MTANKSLHRAGYGCRRARPLPWRVCTGRALEAPRLAGELNR